MTRAEACLWKYALSAKKLRGYSFRRQRPVLKYIADFMCLELKLIIEVDGRTHLEEATIARDERKQKDLEEAGYTVLRFTDNEVLKHMNAVIGCIEEWIKKNEKGTDSGLQDK